MQKELNQVIDNIKSIVQVDFIPKILSQIDTQKELISDFQKLIIRYVDLKASLNNETKGRIITELIDVNHSIKTLLEGIYKRSEVLSFDEEFSSFSASVRKILDEAQEFAEEIQSIEHFKSQATDNLYVKFIKGFKYSAYRIHQIPTHIVNLFLRLFKKPLRQPRNWKRKFRLKNMKIFFFKELLSLKLLSVYKKLFQLKSLTAKMAWDIYENKEKQFQIRYNNIDSEVNSDTIPDLDFNFETIHNHLDSFRNNIENEIGLILNKILDDYSAAYNKAGTFEFPDRRFSGKQILKKEKELKEKFIRLNNGWSNTLFAMAEDWRVNNEIYHFRYKAIKNLLNVYSLADEKINKNILNRVQEVNLFVDELKSKLQAHPENTIDLKTKFRELNSEITKNLSNNLLPHLINTIADQNIVELLDELKNAVGEGLAYMVDKRTFVKTDLYDKEIKNSELIDIAPKELLSFAALPQFNKSILATNELLSSRIQKIQSSLSEIDHVCAFNIDTAISLLENKKVNAAESKNVAIEGLNRAISKIDNIKAEINNLNKIFKTQPFQALNEFNAEIEVLTNTEKISELKVKIAKAKAIERTRRYKEKALISVKELFPKIFNYIKKLFLLAKESYFRVRDLFGLTPPPRSVQSEISDFLAETEFVIQKLPFVYQRLFVAEPLTDIKFFLGRETEMEEAKKSFASWEKGNYSSTIIVGEKGSGATTLINFLEKNLSTQLKITRKRVNTIIYKYEDLLDLLKSTFDNQNFNSVNDVITYLNELPERQIVILEDIQNLFLRKIGGFSSLKNLFEIISKTNRNVFWLSNCTLYAWNYLVKTINIEDYWGKVIHLKEFTDEQIIQMVMKRHRISGYDIEFETSEEILKSKSFKKIPKEERQNYLEKHYCSSLHKFSQSNLAIAQLYWLRSTIDVVDNCIKIGSVAQFDYSFLSNLSNDKLFALSIMLLHDGISAETHSIIFQVPVEKSRLIFLLLKDDGIIVEKDNLYFINPLMFRQTVRTLKSKNIIH